MLILPSKGGIFARIFQIPARRVQCYYDPKESPSVTMTISPKADAEKIEWPTILMLVATYLLWGFGTWIWSISGPFSIFLTGLLITQHSSLQHEVLHGHPFRSVRLNEALVFPALSLIMPYGRFRDTHLQHHFDPALTDPYDDPESNFLDPAVWSTLSRPVQALLRANNTLLGRMILGPASMAVLWIRSEVRSIRQGVPGVALSWGLNVLGLIPVLGWLGWVGMPLWAYAISVYFGMSVLRIRTFLEHRAHDAFRARTVIVEGRGPLALLFLNNNLHAVHHMHPKVSWYRLPALYAAHKDHYQRRNGGYVYRNYSQIFASYFLKAKDPVPHPIWPVRKSEPADKSRAHAPVTTEV